jgi:hypothetical protein
LLLGTKKGQRDAQRTSSLLGTKSTDKKIELEQEKQKKISDPAAAHHKTSGQNLNLMVNKIFTP